MNEQLEKAIGEVGREKVFARAVSYGWPSGSGAPEWIWWGIVQEIRDNKPPPYMAGQNHLAGLKRVFGF